MLSFFDFPERFQKKVMPEPMSGCWLWIAATSGRGYGAFSFDGKQGYAHRYSCSRAHGEIPKGMEVDHLCKVISCVNPNHLEIVTPQVNRERSSLKEGFRKWCNSITHCPQDHEYTVSNTYVHNGKKQCRVCVRLAGATFDARNRAKRALAARLHRKRKREALAMGTEV